MKNGRKIFKKSLQGLVREAINQALDKIANRDQIIRHIITKEPELADNKNRRKLINEVKSILRTSKSFKKEKRTNTKNLYKWRVDDELLIMQKEYEDAYESRPFIGLEIIKTANISKERVLLYNSLYHTNKNGVVLPEFATYEPENIFDVKRNVGDFLRQYFSLNKTYLFMQKSMLDGKDCQRDFLSLLDEANFPKDFLFKDVDYEYVNKMIFAKCKRNKDRISCEPDIKKERFENSVLYLSSSENNNN